ncbi:MAG: TorF family putative porin, partial [Gammaproteobacteria bacterium]
PFALSASANVGFNEFLEDNYSYINWDIGLTVSIDSWFDVDLRYYDTDEPEVDCKNSCDARFVAAISRSF